MNQQESEIEQGLISKLKDLKYTHRPDIRDKATLVADERFLPIYRWAEEGNSKVTHLDDFAKKFLLKGALGYTINRYVALVASKQKLMIKRPYQIYAVKSVVDCIHQDRRYRYIWHTTGSGKTPIAEADRLHALKNLKKGLAPQLFPTLESKR